MTAKTAVVIGAGFYGCLVAIRLRELGLRDVLVIDSADAPMTRASLRNQARIHRGYHYPRDFVTAFRSASTFRRFVDRYGDAAVGDFAQVYAIASRGSHVSARQFLSVMRSIGVPCAGAERKHAALFSPNLVEAVFSTDEMAFDSVKLAVLVAAECQAAGVRFRMACEAVGTSDEPGRTGVTLSDGEFLSADLVMNCTYGRLHALHPGGLRRRLKYEACEICLMEPPPMLAGVGITVMDGPFFSCMPYPSRGLHSLTHVRHTPRFSWVAQDDPERDPYAEVDGMDSESRFANMREDAARFVPVMSEARFAGSLREVKAILMANEANDGRPILIDGPISSGVTSILGGKLDNVFDVLARIDTAFGIQGD